jgi:hypothetical protein
MKKIITTAAIVASLSFGMGDMQNNKMSNKLSLEQVNSMKAGMQMKLKYDYSVNFPILMRAVFKQGKKLNLTKEQKIAIKKHKIDVMDTINPAMKKSHMLSKKLKDALLYGNISKEEAFKLSKEIATLKEQVVNMKITCITFIKNTLTKEQFAKLIELDKKMPYLNYPYNY